MKDKECIGRAAGYASTYLIPAMPVVTCVVGFLIFKKIRRHFNK